MLGLVGNKRSCAVKSMQWVFLSLLQISAMLLSREAREWDGLEEEEKIQR